MRRYRKGKIRNKVDDGATNPGQASRKKSSGTLIPRNCCVFCGKGSASHSTETNSILKKIFQVAQRPPAVHIELEFKKSWVWGAGREGRKEVSSSLSQPGGY